MSVEIITLLGELEERADQRWQAMEEKRLKMVVETEQDRRREQRKHEDNRCREERKHEERMMQMMTSAMGLFHQNAHAYTPAQTYMPPPPTTPSYSPTHATFNPRTHVQPYGSQSPLNTTHCQPSPYTLSYPSDEEHN